MTVSFTPTFAFRGGWVVFDTNDPVSDNERLLLTWDSRTVRTRSRLLALSDTLALGQAVTVKILTDAVVRLDSAWVYYRPDSTETYERSRLAQQDSVPIQTWIGVIPGDAVGERGLEHYVKLLNRWFEVDDPPSGPASPFHNEVQPPSRITVTALPNQGAQGRQIDVFVEVPLGSQLAFGQLHYRKGGETRYVPVRLVPTVGAISLATIPSSSVGARGVEYWVEVTTRRSALTYPQVRRIRVQR